MKKFVMIAMAISLSACQAAPVVEESQENRAGYKTICLDGVQYWHRRGGNGREAIAVRIDPETMQPSPC